MATTVAVIGAGIVGASVAFRLTQGGAQVIVVDQGQPGSGTTGASFAWVNSNQKTPRDYFELNFAGLREHWRLRDELGEAPWFHPGGNLIWATDPEQMVELAERVDRLQEWGYAAGWIDAGVVNAEMEPVLAFPSPRTSVAFFPDEAWVSAPLCARRLVELAAEAGATLRLDVAVEGIEVEAGRVRGIRLAGGEQVPVDAVVNAAGPQADRVASMAGLPLPLAPTNGLLVRIAVGVDPLARLVHAPEVNARPDGPGHLLLGHTSIDAQLGDRTTVALDEPLCQELVERVKRILPGAAAGARVTEARVGVRAIPEDGLSCVGAVSALPGYYEAVTHSGVTLGPLLGRLMAQIILEEQTDPLLLPFSPDRFPRG